MKTKFYNIAQEIHIGTCIYCGSTENLSDEHAMPYSMQGDLVLLKASCGDCAKITCKFEGQVARGLFEPIRAALGVRTRRPKERPKDYSVLISKDGVVGPKKIPIVGNPSFITLPVFSMPLRMGLLPPELGMNGFLGWNTYLINGGRNEYDDLRKRFNADAIALINPRKDSELVFARFLAKIAYCHTVGFFGLDVLEENLVVPVIRGETDDILQHVGCINANAFDRFEELVEPEIIMRVGVKHLAKWVWVQIKIFTLKNTPPYLVIVGKLTDDAAANFVEDTWHIRDYRLDRAVNLRTRDEWFMPT